MEGSAPGRDNVRRGTRKAPVRPGRRSRPLVRRRAGNPATDLAGNPAFRQKPGLVPHPGTQPSAGGLAYGRPDRVSPTHPRGRRWLGRSWVDSEYPPGPLAATNTLPEGSLHRRQDAASAPAEPRAYRPDGGCREARVDSANRRPIYRGPSAGPPSDHERRPFPPAQPASTAMRWDRWNRERSSAERAAD